MRQRYEEPRLRDLLEDPLTGLMMARDGVSRAALESLIARIAAWRAGRGTIPLATSRDPR
jgi:hypothetical protein